MRYLSNQHGVNTLTAAGTLDASASTVANAVKVPVWPGDSDGERRSGL